MTPAQIIAAVIQIISLFPTVEPALMRAIQDLRDLIEGGGEVSQAQLDALVARIDSQSAQIQSMS